MEYVTVELRHVRYFIAVAEYLNFRKAAQRLHIAQPPLSRQIHQLEEELGVELFARDKRSVELTQAGHAFLEQARKLIVQANYAVAAARQAHCGDTGTVKIGIASGVGSVVGKAICEFRKLWPTVEVECRDIFSSRQSELLRKHEIDIGFLRPPLDHAVLNCELLYEEEFVVILPKFHRLARRNALRMNDIANEPLIIFDRNVSTGLYDKILGLYSRHGLTPRLISAHVEAHEEAGAITIGSGNAIFIGAEAIVNRSVAGIELASVPLNEPEARIEVYAAWRQDERSPLANSFLGCVRTHKHTAK